MNKKEVKESRHYLLTQANKVTKIRKGDKRVHGSRVCSLCGRPLSKVILSTGKTQASVNHYHCHFNELLAVDICMDIRSCYSRVDKEED